MTLQNQFDLSSPEGKVEYLKAAGAMIARLASPVEREVYGGRAAEAAGVSRESMLQEIERSRRSVVRREKKELEREETRPTQTAQPRDRGLRYTNVRSAAAEEGVLRLLMLDPALLACCDLQENEFSSGFLGRIYGILRSRIENKQTVSAAALSGELEGEEMSQLVRITQKPEELSGAKKSLQDYITVIRTEKLKNTTDLLALANRYKETKGMEDGKSDKKG
jgi:DNA primase